MINATCMRMRALMDGRAHGLSEADRLRLESHTASCAACFAHSETLSRVVALARSAPSTMSDATRERVIARAVSHAAPQPATAVPMVSAWSWQASAMRAVLVAGTVMVALAILIVWRRAEPSASTVVDASGAQPGTVSSSATFEHFAASADARRVTVAGATFDLAAHSAIDWDERAARVTLRQGSVRAVVASRAGKTPLSVRTPSFDVIVVGTDFEVTLQAVRVHEGVVRIQDHAGRVLHPALRASEAWSSALADTRQGPDAVADDNAGAANEAALSHGADKPDRAATTQNARAWIAEARTLLSTGDVSRARRALERAEQLTLTTPQRLEVGTLLAESYQVAGEPRRAIAQYDRVVRLDSSSAAADNAAFAAARLTLSSGDRVDAKQRFADYLLAHPHGRFRVEVARALRALGSEHDD